MGRWSVASPYIQGSQAFDEPPGSNPGAIGSAVVRADGSRFRLGSNLIQCGAGRWWSEVFVKNAVDVVWPVEASYTDTVAAKRLST